MDEGIAPVEIAPTIETVDESDSVDSAADTPAATKKPTTVQQSNVRPSGSCALPLE